MLWDTRSVKGDHSVRAAADAAGAVAESNEGNNAGTLAVTVKGNKVQNGSFEQANSSGSGPAAWEGQSTGAGSASWSDGGSDGPKSASVSGNGGSAALFGVLVDERADRRHAGRDARSRRLGKVERPLLRPDRRRRLPRFGRPAAPDGERADGSSEHSGFQVLERVVPVPAGAARACVVLTGFSRRPGHARHGQLRLRRTVRPLGSAERGRQRQPPPLSRAWHARRRMARPLLIVNPYASAVSEDAVACRHADPGARRRAAHRGPGARHRARAQGPATARRSTPLGRRLQRGAERGRGGDAARFIPGGGTSVLPRALGLPRDPVEAARRVAAGRTRRISLGRANGRRFGFVSASTPS